jgi:hypothetical protein
MAGRNFPKGKSRAGISPRRAAEKVMVNFSIITLDMPSNALYNTPNVRKNREKPFPEHTVREGARTLQGGCLSLTVEAGTVCPECDSEMGHAIVDRNPTARLSRRREP